MFAALPEGFDPSAVYSDDSYWEKGGELHYLDGYDKHWRNVRRFYEARIPRILSLTRARRMLEIGCADGRFLAAARRAGFEVAGVELSDVMRERCAKSVGCPVFRSIEEVLASGRRFDCVAMFELIEHLPDPLAFMGQVYEIMSPDGFLALSTPNFDSAAAIETPDRFMHFLPPAHICYFGPETLADCLARAGFKVVAVDACFCAQEVPLPEPVAALLRPFRRGKQRLRPGGLIGKLLKAYLRRRALSMAREPGALKMAETFEVYAVKTRVAPRVNTA